MCGGSSKATAYKAPAVNYQPTQAPYGVSGTATPSSAVPVAASTYPSYPNRYQPANGISPGNYAQLGAMRDSVMGRASQAVGNPNFDDGIRRFLASLQTGNSGQ
jgi:hypothetical protein